MSKGSVCLAYSGGLDTSTILVWLLDQGFEVHGYLCDVGQKEDWDAVKSKALKLGAASMQIDDLRLEFLEGPLYSSLMCNAIFEDNYLLGTSLARPVIAEGLLRYAKAKSCQYLSHGATGKGNDCIRLELSWLALDPTVKIIAPWRDNEFCSKFQGRNDLLEFARLRNIPVESTLSKPFSMDENLAHCSYEAGILEDPSIPAPLDIWKLTNNPEQAPNKPEQITIEWVSGKPVALVVGEEKITEPLEIWSRLNSLGKEHGIGRIDIVESRFNGLKSRGCYDAPAHTILRASHIDLEGLVLDSHVRRLRDTFVTHGWTRCIYEGKFHSPEREYLQKCIVSCQEYVTGSSTMLLYKGLARAIARASKYSLYSPEDASMDSLTNFNPQSTTESIRLKSSMRQKQVDNETAK